MILLGSEYRVSQWFINGCSKLILRNCGPTEEESNLLGIGFVVKIYGLREHMLSLRIPKGSETYQSETVAQLVKDKFPDMMSD